MPTIDLGLAKGARRYERLLAAIVLVGSWLAFQVQPMAGKRILPWFGGGPAVWTTVMLFFQALLLVGYFYSHWLTRSLRPRGQAVVHAVLLGAAAVFLATWGVIAGDAWKPIGSDHPQLRILAILAVTVGLPYVMLTSTAPLVQSWWGWGAGRRSPYRLYAISNFGSLAALVSYPFVVEPLLGARTQGMVWSGLFLVFAVLSVAGGYLASQREVSDGEATASMPSLPPRSNSKVDRKTRKDRETAHKLSAETTWVDRFFWVALPACASVMLLAVTNHLCRDVAPVPLLWLAPLVTYLLTFILTFESDRWYRRVPWLVVLGMFSAAACWCWGPNRSVLFGWQIAIHLTLLFAVGMVCHGEMAARRPGPQQLTSFYLSLAAGGAMGGLFVAILAPLLFHDYEELPLGMLATWVLVLGVMASDPLSALYRGRNRAAWIGLVALVIGLALSSRDWTHLPGTTTIAAERNFFGVLKVVEYDWSAIGAHDGTKSRRLEHGWIAHGAQFLKPNRRGEPTQYYGRNSGVGQLLGMQTGDAPRRVGVVGLGAGTLAAYAKAGDDFRFYEIDPQVVRYADMYFTYLSDARERGAKIDVAVDDGRLALEREEPQQFDVLALDAFSSDAIPVHLLTKEAFAVYLRHLRQPGGVLAVHVTNRSLDLAPVVQAAADRFGLETRVVDSPGDPLALVQPTRWILLYSKNTKGRRELLGQPLVFDKLRPTPVLWTDDYSSLLDVIMWE